MTIIAWLTACAACFWAGKWYGRRIEAAEWIESEKRNRAWEDVRGHGKTSDRNFERELNEEIGKVVEALAERDEVLADLRIAVRERDEARINRDDLRVQVATLLAEQQRLRSIIIAEGVDPDMPIPPGPALERDRLRDRCETLTNERDDLQRRLDSLNTPNLWKCDACDFQVSKNVLYAQSGGVAADTRDTDELCPNDGFILRRLTWEECSNNNFRALLDRAEEANKLRQAIEKHRAQKADDKCWMDDQDLYAVLGDGNLGDNRVGDPEAMLENCKRFIANRCAGGGWKTYAELEALLEAYRAKRAVDGGGIKDPKAGIPPRPWNGPLHYEADLKIEEMERDGAKEDGRPNIFESGNRG